MTAPLAAAFAILVLALVVIWSIVRRLGRELATVTAGGRPAEITDRPGGVATRDGLVSLAMARHAARPHEDIGVVAFEIADLAGIKNSLGPAVAEQVVAEIARRLEKNSRATEDLARSTEDRFVLMLAPPVDPYGAVRAASRLSETATRPFAVADVTLQIQVHAGVAVGPVNEAGLVLDNAEFALNRARQTGQTTPVLYDETERENAEITFRRAQALRTAVEHDELTVAYQPILELGTGAIAGFEALLRWESPTLGPVSPADFIPIAEDTGAIIEIGSWVLERACLDLHRLSATSHRGFVTVNVSVHQLRHQGFVEIVGTALMASELDPSRLTLEVTESTFANPIEVASTLEVLRQLGVRVALDDVGTGYSSLAQLATLPIDVMKLDRTLLRDQTEPDDPASRVFTSLAALGRSLGMDVVAEGVETEEQSTFALVAGCTHEQGFLRSRPVPLADAVAFARHLDEAPHTR